MQKRAGGVVQVVEHCLPSSNPSAAKKKKKIERQSQIEKQRHTEKAQGKCGGKC
jgi:hypothetical protein